MNEMIRHAQQEKTDVILPVLEQLRPLFCRYGNMRIVVKCYERYCFYSTLGHYRNYRLILKAVKMH